MSVGLSIFARWVMEVSAYTTNPPISVWRNSDPEISILINPRGNRVERVVESAIHGISGQACNCSSERSSWRASDRKKWQSAETVWCCFVRVELFVFVLAGPINWILTLRGLLPVSRLSFCFYLMHIFVLELKVIHQRGYHEARHYLQTVTALGCICISLFCAFVYHCLVENPVNNLVNVFFGDSRVSTLPDVDSKKEVKLPEFKPKPHEIPIEKCYL